MKYFCLPELLEEAGVPLAGRGAELEGDGEVCEGLLGDLGVPGLGVHHQLQQQVHHHQHHTWFNIPSNKEFCICKC